MRRLMLLVGCVAVAVLMGADVPAGSSSAVVSGATMIDLGRGHAWGINDRGQIVGESATAGGSGHAFLWENGKMTDLGTLGGATSVAYAINDRGQIVGSSFGSSAAGQRVSHAFLWENGKMTDLGTLGEGATEARAINERGEIVGVLSYPSGESRAILWSVGATPAPPAPRLTERRTGTLLRASRSATVASVTTWVAVDRQATVALAVRNPRSGARLTLQTGTRLAATTLERRATTVTAKLAKARTFSLRALVPAAQLRRGTAYQLVLTATGPSGKSSRLTIRFLG